MTTSFNDWVALRKLVPSNIDGLFKYSLTVRCTGACCRSKAGHVDFGEKALYSRFNAYDVSRQSTKEFEKTSVLWFRTFFQTYRAWVETNKSMLNGHPIAVEPTGGSLDSTKVHMVLVSRLPKQTTVTTFVTQFVRYHGLLFVDARPREDCAILGYSEQSSVEKACSDVVKLKVDGNEFTVVVEPLDKRPPKSVPSVLKAVEANKLKKGLLKTPVVNTTTTPAGGKEETRLNGVHKHSSARTAAKPHASQFSIESQYNNTAMLSSLISNVPHKQDNRKHTARSQHRFDIDSRQYLEMFKACDSDPPDWGDAETDGRVIKFVIVNQQDSIRFWAWLWDDGQNARDLVELEKYIRHTAPGSPVPGLLPRHGERGIALDQKNDRLWFRCYILSVDTRLEILSVFFCDYGITTHIPKECFRYTAKVVWSLPPQAIPLKLFGYSLTKLYDPEDVETISLLRGNVLKADVKVAGSHVVQINNIVLDHSGICIDKDIIGACGKYIKRTRHNSRLNNSQVNPSQEENKDGQKFVQGMRTSSKSHIVKIPSLFDYEPENLQLALLTEVRDHNLIYLRTNFEVDLEVKLDKCRLKLVSATNLATGDIALLSNEAVNHRIAVLQLSTALNKLKVIHVDHGYVEWVSADDLYELPSDIKDYPYQATAPSLAGLVCENEKVEEAIVFLKTRVKSMVRMQFIGRVGGVELFDPDTNRSLNLEMVQRGLASVDDTCLVKQDLGTLESPASDSSSLTRKYKSPDWFEDLDIGSLILEARGRIESIVQSDTEVSTCFSSSLEDNSDYQKRFQRQKESAITKQQQQQQQLEIHPQLNPHDQQHQQQQQQWQQQQYQQSPQQRQQKQQSKQQQTFSSRHNRKDESHAYQGTNQHTRKVYKRQDDTLAVNVKNVPPPPDIVISTNIRKQSGGDFEYHRQLVRGRGRSLSSAQSR